MLVASNTSPLCNLAIIGRLDLLRSQFTRFGPKALKTELYRLSHTDALMDIQEALCAGWVKVQAIGQDRVARLLKTTLDRAKPKQ